MAARLRATSTLVRWSWFERGARESPMTAEARPLTSQRSVFMGQQAAGANETNDPRQPIQTVAQHAAGLSRGRGGRYSFPWMGVNPAVGGLRRADQLLTVAEIAATAVECFFDAIGKPQIFCLGDPAFNVVRM